MVLDNIIFEKATGIASKHTWVAKGICINSKNLKQGDLFVAFKGKHFNGNSFAKHALANGACACLVSEVENEEDLKNYPLILIDNPFKTIQQIASHKRQIIKGKVIAITGSYGKTTSKDMIKTVLQDGFKISSTYANENNTLGAPLSLARMDLEDDLGVFEVGMNHKGEIDEIVKILQPDIVLLNEIAPLHFENFTNLKDIVDAKLEILNGNKCSTLILSKDDANYDYIVKKAQVKNIKNIVSYGFAKDANFSATSAELNNFKYNVSALLNGFSCSYTLNSVALHNVKISCLVLALCSVLNVNLQKAAKNLENFSVTKGRGDIKKTNHKGKNITIYNDSYNASGMKESLVSFANIAKNTRNILVLGQMLELGAISEEKHKNLASAVVLSNPAFILLLGKEMLFLQDELSKHNVTSYYFNNLEDLEDFLNLKLLEEDFVFIKGSYGSQVFKLADTLLMQ